MKENNLRDLFKYALEQDTKVRRGIIYSILNKIFDLAPPSFNWYCNRYSC